MAKCKYYERNMEEKKCSHYYWSHTKSTSIVRCRIPEWKQKKGICPYDKTIVSKSEKIKKDIKDNKQQTITTFK